MDIGAHIGLCAADALRTPGSRIIAIELSSRYRKVLLRNLAAIDPTERFNMMKEDIRPNPWQ